MQMLSWRQVNLGSVIFAGLVAGYVMQLAGLWADAVPGLVGVDFADFGRRYIISDRTSAWIVGLLSHLANSILLVFVFAAVLVPNIPWPLPLLGLAWGEALALVLAGALVAPLTGLGFLGFKSRSPRWLITTLLLHAVWGLLVGVLYIPR
jgi:hypothetical protein